MIRSELKKKALTHLHGHYGNWSLIAILPCVALFIYFFSMVILFQSSTSVVNPSNDYRSWQEEYTERSNRSDSNYESGYDDGYLDGYDDGYDERLDEEDLYEEDDYTKKDIHSLANSPKTASLRNTRTVTYAQTTTMTTGIGSFFAFLVGMILCILTILYRGMVQWAAVDNVDGQDFNFKTVFLAFMNDKGKRTVVANLLVTLYTFLWSLLFVIPGVIKQLSYGMTNYLLKKDPDLSPKEAMALSQALMQGYKMEYLVFSYSFVLWQFATFFSFGLASIYVIPYYSVSEVLFFDQIIAEKHHLFSQEKEAGFTDF